jgi:hypothetical protein
MRTVLVLVGSAFLTVSAFAADMQQVKPSAKNTTEKIMVAAADVKRLQPAPVRAAAAVKAPVYDTRFSNGSLEKEGCCGPI